RLFRTLRPDAPLASALESRAGGECRTLTGSMLRSSLRADAPPGAHASGGPALDTSTEVTVSRRERSGAGQDTPPAVARLVAQAEARTSSLKANSAGRPPVWMKTTVSSCVTRPDRAWSIRPAIALPV